MTIGAAGAEYNFNSCGIELNDVNASRNWSNSARLFNLILMAAM